MKAKLIRVELGNPYYFTQYYYKCIECGREYIRHQCNDRISPYCGQCQRKHDSEAQKQRNINNKNKLIREELVKIKEKIDIECETVDEALDVIIDRIIELRGDK